MHSACDEYAKRLKRFCTLSIVELGEAKIPGNASPAQVSQAVCSESNAILAALNKTDYVIALDVGGVAISSEEFSEIFSKQMNLGKSSFCFVIGGSNGYDESVRERANAIVSFSRLTFPHQLFRVIALEQIYRAMKILNGERYHK